MRKIRLKFLGLGYGRVNQALVKIYDHRGRLVCCKKTCNNEIYVCLKNGCYFVKAYSCTGKLARRLIVSPRINTYYFVFKNIMYNPISNTFNRTFLLTDYNYTNLPIGKGILNFG